MVSTPPDPEFKRWRLVENKFSWWPIILGAILWPIAIAVPYKLATPEGNLFTGLLQLFGVFCLFVGLVLWLISLIISVYRRFWRHVGSLLTALIAFFVVGSIVGYRL
jgi:hypothetical protein